VWILGLRPTAGQGGGLKVGKSSSETSAVITTAVMADLPVLAKVTIRVHTVPYILLLIKNNTGNVKKTLSYRDTHMGRYTGN
jgi:hypothetical protein